MRTALLLALLLALGCADVEDAAPPAPSPAEQIIADARQAHGADALDHAEVAFDFREYQFSTFRDGGRYRYVRTYADSLGRTVQESLDNDGIQRQVDGEPVPLSDSAAARVITPLNSVPYFALLPYNLTDPAVQPRLLGETTIRGEPYYEVEVTFRQEGGGVDHEDRFVYWFHRDRKTMDYLAYRFHVDGGGVRFREATNVRTVGGVRFADYLNYESEYVGESIERFDEFVGTDTLQLLSTVDLENVRVQPLSEAL